MTPRYSRFDKRTRSFLLRYITAINLPALDTGGEVAWVLHLLEEVTRNVRVGTASSPPETDTAVSAPYPRTRDLVRRNRELGRAIRVTRRALEEFLAV